MITSLRNRASRGFTLVELLIVLLIVAIIAGMSISALAGAAEEGRRQRARVQIAKLDALIMEKWNSYRFRQVPIKTSKYVTRNDNSYMYKVGELKLYALRDLMRLEMPQSIWEVYQGPVSLHEYGNAANTGSVASLSQSATIYPLTRPALAETYQRLIPFADFNAYTANGKTTHEEAECLYLIVSQLRDGDRSALNFFLPSEIGDVDGDSLKEILDPWGTPIIFLRWAPGFSAITSSDSSLAGLNIPPIQVSSVTSQVPNGALAPDPFDPLRIDPRWQAGNNQFKPFALKPLIISAGPDRAFDTGVVRQPSVVHDPYAKDINGNWAGMVLDTNNDGRLSYADNITNHGLTLEGG